MDRLLIFLTVSAAMVATSFWESYVEGPNAWDKKKYGWKLKFGKFVLSAYHFWLFVIMFPILIVLFPLVLVGFSVKFTYFLIGTYLVGVIIEDFFYFVVNPFWGLKKWNSKNVNYYPWFKIGRFEIPVLYVFCLSFGAFLIWLSF